MTDHAPHDAAEEVYGQGLRAERSGDLAQAEQHYRRFAELRPQDPRGPNKRGVLLALRGEWAAAQRCFDEALSLDRTFAPALTNSGNLLIERGDVAGAIARYEEALAADPLYPVAHQNLAAALKRTGELRGMVRHLKQAQRSYRDAARTEGASERRGCAGRAGAWLLLLALGALQIGTFWR